MASRDTRRSGPPPSTSRGLTRGSRGVTRGSQARTAQDDGETGVGTRSQARTAGGQTRQTGRSRGSQQTGGPVSLFDAVKKAGSRRDEDGGGGDVKADDIWNKFLTDDNDVVRAPTAESGGSEGTGITGSQGSQLDEDDEGEDNPEDEEEEEEEESSEDDDRTIYSDYYMAPGYVSQRGTPEIRTEIIDSHEACSCFPNRSSKFIGAMLYDKIQCVHSGLVGETQSGVFKFNPYWNENMEIPRRMRKRDLRIAKTKYVFGYPRPKFEIVSESEEDEEEYDEGDSDEEHEERSTTIKTPKTARTKASRRGGEDEDDEYDSEYDSEYDDDEYGDEDDDEDYVPFELPQIGYPQTPSLPPSSQSRRSVYSEYSEYTESVPELPPIPASRQLTAQTRRTGVTQRTQRSVKTAKTTKTVNTGKATAKSSKKAKSKSGESVDSGYDDNRSRRSLASSRQSLPAGPVVSNVRTFQGKFYDPVSKQIMLYDIASRPGERLPGGNMEPLNKPPTVASQTKPKQQPKTAEKSKSESKPASKASQRSQGSHHEVGIKAAVLGNVFIQNLLSKNKANKATTEAKFSDEED